MEGRIEMMSKKGQVAIIAVLLMLAMIWFAFKTQQDRLDTVILAGQKQAELVSAYVEPELARYFLQQAAKQAVLEIAWKMSNGNTACPFSSLSANPQNFNSNLSELWRDYASYYTGTDAALQVYLPNYNVTASIANDKIAFKAWAREESCKSTIPFPPKPCTNQESQADCNSVLRDDGSPACTWLPNFCFGPQQPVNCTNFDEINCNANNESGCSWGLCTDVTPQPDCAAAYSENDVRTACMNQLYCAYTVTDAGALAVRQEEYVEYVFEIAAAAYVEANITCDDYAKYAAKRADKYVKPNCGVVFQQDCKNQRECTCNVSYQSWDNAPPGDMYLEIINSTSHTQKIDIFKVGALQSGFVPFGTNAANYQNAESWSGKTVLANDTYSVKITCNPLYGSPATIFESAPISFIVSEL